MSAGSLAAGAAWPYHYRGPDALQLPLRVALSRVIDPELALTIVDLGLVNEVCVGDGLTTVQMTMTSAACPVTEIIVDDVRDELERVLPAGHAVEVEIVWEPAWTPDRMSERARRFMQD